MTQRGPARLSSFKCKSTGVKKTLSWWGKMECPSSGFISQTHDGKKRGKKKKKVVPYSLGCIIQCRKIDPGVGCMHDPRHNTKHPPLFLSPVYNNEKSLPDGFGVCRPIDLGPGSPVWPLGIIIEALCHPVLSPDPSPLPLFFFLSHVAYLTRLSSLQRHESEGSRKEFFFP